jgi:Haem-binding domain
VRRLLLGVVTVLVVGALAIQLVPYGRDHTNPPVTGEPAWDSAATRAVAVAACFDCHSNETRWPWYSTIAPISWRLQRHVDEGRAKLNFSEWGTGEQETGDIVEMVADGSMPPWDYRLLHPEASLSEADRQALMDGLARTFGSGGPGTGGAGTSGEGGED